MIIQGVKRSNPQWESKRDQKKKNVMAKWKKMKERPNKMKTKDHIKKKRKKNKKEKKMRDKCKIK